jgi:hypothetical protein
MNIEKAKERLAKIEAALNNNRLSDSFHLGRVGFRKHTKKYLNSIEKRIDMSIEASRLKEKIEEYERKQTIVIDLSKSLYYSEPSELLVGRIYQDYIYGRVTVIKRNKKTVTLKTGTGFTFTREPKFIFKP